jgi:hypothetical protein
MAEGSTRFGKLAVPESYLNLPAWEVYTTQEGEAIVLQEGSEAPAGAERHELRLFATTEDHARKQLQNIMSNFPDTFK